MSQCTKENNLSMNNNSSILVFLINGEQLEKWDSYVREKREREREERKREKRERATAVPKRFVRMATVRMVDFTNKNPRGQQSGSYAGYKPLCNIRHAACYTPSAERTHRTKAGVGNQQVPVKSDTVAMFATILLARLKTPSRSGRNRLPQTIEPTQ